MPVVAYKVTSPKAKKEEFILIESTAVGTVPRNAALGSVKKAAVALEESLEPISAVADSVFKALRKINNPGRVEVEFGVELGGKVGFPLIVSGEGKANFKVTLAWENGNSGT